MSIFKSCKDGAHKFEPRYNTIPPVVPTPYEGSLYGMVTLINAATRKEYVRDVCVKCGLTTSIGDSNEQKS